MSAERTEWWGFSQEHGWIVHDREDPRNVSGSLIIHFFRCSDSAEIVIPRDEWEPPEIRGFKRYLASIANEALRSLAERQLLKCQGDYQQTKGARLEGIRRDLEDQKRAEKDERNRRISAKHEQYLRTAGLPAHGRATFVRFVRNTVCWKCKTPINSIDDLACTNCRGIICHSCGACFCGRE